MQLLSGKKKWVAGTAALCAAIALACVPFPAAKAEAVAAPDAAGDDAALVKLQDVANGTKILTRKVMRGMVRVKIDQNPEALLSKEMKAAWDDFLRNNRGRGGPMRFEIAPARPAGGNPRWGGGPGGGGQSGPGNQGGRDRPGGRDDERRAATEPATQPLPKFNAQMMPELERFVASRVSEQDAAKASDAQLTLTKLRALRQVFSGDMYANIYDDAGHALLFTAIILPAEKMSLHAYLSDGTEVVAKVTGTNFIRGFTVLQIEDKNGSPIKGSFNSCGTGRPEAGELMMTLSPTGGVSFGAMPISGFGRKPEARFAYTGNGLLYTTRGELAAFISEGTGITVASLADEIKMMADGRTISPKSLGIQYAALKEDASERSKNKLIGSRAAVKVAGVLKGYPGESADIRKDDVIVSIDGQSVNQLQRVLEEWQIRGHELKLEIVRGDETLAKSIKSEK